MTATAGRLGPARSVTAAGIAAFRRDGAVHLPGAFPTGWLAQLAAGIARDRAASSSNHAADPGAPAYLETYLAWSRIPEFERVWRVSGCGAQAAALLGPGRVNLVMDNWFLREAGARSRPPVHQDLSYFDFEGSMCVLWLPLEVCKKEDGIAFVPGAHRWGRLYMRVRFRDGHEGSGPQVVRGLEYHAPRDVAGDPGAYDLLAGDCALGNTICFDRASLHGALAETVPRETVRRFTPGMTAPDGRIGHRGDWAAGERGQIGAAGYREGDPIAGDVFPRL